jgi:hypothetical protein
MCLINDFSSLKISKYLKMHSLFKLSYTLNTAYIIRQGSKL